MIHLINTSCSVYSHRHIQLVELAMFNNSTNGPGVSVVNQILVHIAAREENLFTPNFGSIDTVVIEHCYFNKVEYTDIPCEYVLNNKAAISTGQLSE